ncbi:MAG: GLPGLI family protein, partial [Moheibacter sp.]
SNSFRILAIWVGENLLFFIITVLKLMFFLLLNCTIFGEAYNTSMSANANPVYKNTGTKTYTEEAPFAEKTFLIKDNLPEIDWKITKETKEIAGFPVQKASAILTDEYKTEIEAWYSPKFNYKTGPDKFWGLPGIILEIQTQITYDDGSKEGTKYVATKVEVVNSNENIKIPSKGKEITQQEFTEMAIEFMEREMEMYNDGVEKD